MLGAARFYVDDDHWQDTVARLARQSGLVVIRLGTTDGLRWEIDHAVRNLPPERILLFVPHSAEHRVCYDAFRAVADDVLPRKLPPLAGQPRFIRFDRSWRAYFMGDNAALLFDARPPVFMVDSRAQQSRRSRKELKALSAVFSEIGPVVALVLADQQTAGELRRLDGRR